MRTTNLLLDTDSMTGNAATGGGLRAIVAKGTTWLRDHPVEAQLLLQALEYLTGQVMSIVLADRRTAGWEILKFADKNGIRPLFNRNLRRAFVGKVLKDANLPEYNPVTGSWVNIAGRLVWLTDGFGTVQTGWIKQWPVNYLQFYNQALTRGLQPNEASKSAMEGLYDEYVFPTLGLPTSTLSPLVMPFPKPELTGNAPALGALDYINLGLASDRGMRTITEQTPESFLESLLWEVADNPLPDMGRSIQRDGNCRGNGSYRCNNKGKDPFYKDGALPIGNIFQSSWLKVDVGPISPEDYAQVDMTNRPFHITLSSQMLPSRAEVSLAHEIMHVMSSLYKLNLTHEQIHDVSVFLVSEAIPAINAFNRKKRNGK